MAMMVYCSTENLVRAPMLSGHKTASYGGSCVTPSRAHPTWSKLHDPHTTHESIGCEML
ncbi:hypothetical protein K439DRAFT_1634676 [Ramaria rubella]|nr:hypothetical protein K439DRAFT_1634676 [Ramaria rubella]